MRGVRKNFENFINLSIVYIIINIHAFTLNHQVANGNDSEMDIVLRDHRGAIIKMYSSTI